MPKSPSSTRAYEHALLSFGMVTVPVSVFTGINNDAAGVKRREFTAVPVLDENQQPIIDKITQDDGTIVEVPRMEDHPVGRMARDVATGEALEPGTVVVRKIETDYGFVEVADHEIEQLFELNPKTIEVKAFQPRHLWDAGHYVPKSLYHLEASKLKVGTRKMDNKKAQQALALVLAAMREKNAIAVVEFTTHGTPKPAILHPDGTLWMIYHTEELREQRPLPQIELAPQVVAAGVAVINTLWTEEPLDVADNRSALIRSFAAEKAEAGDFGASEAPEETDVQAVEGDDLLAMLTASVQGIAQAG